MCLCKDYNDRTNYYYLCSARRSSLTQCSSRNTVAFVIVVVIKSLLINLSNYGIVLSWCVSSTRHEEEKARLTDTPYKQNRHLNINIIFNFIINLWIRVGAVVSALAFNAVITSFGLSPCTARL